MCVCVCVCVFVCFGDSMCVCSCIEVCFFLFVLCVFLIASSVVSEVFFFLSDLLHIVLFFPVFFFL